MLNYFRSTDKYGRIISWSKIPLHIFIKLNCLFSFIIIEIFHYNNLPSQCTTSHTWNEFLVTSNFLRYSKSIVTDDHFTFRYFEAYRRNGLEFWGMAPQNEPENYKYLPVSVNLSSMAWTAEEQRDWLIEYLEPTLKKNDLGHIKIFTLDDNRLSLPDWAKTTYKDEKARDIISGTAIHFYFDTFVSPSVLDEIKQLFPEKSLIYTEACVGVFQG